MKHHLKNKVILFAILILSTCMCSCNSNKKKETDAINFAPQKLESADTLVTMYEDFPASLDVRENLLCVTTVKSDTCLALFDKVSGEFIKRLGIKGNGPQDMQSPEFVKNSCFVDDARLMFYDLNQQKSFFINKDASLEDFSPLQAHLGSLNVTSEYIIGHQTGFDPSLFQLVNRKTGEVTSTPLHPQIPETMAERFKNMLGYMYSPNVICNEAQNRIVLGMYFFDMIQVYNFKDEWQKTLTLGEEKDFEKMISTLTNNGNYWGYPFVYATKDFCYLCRVLTEGSTGNSKQNQIVKMDWEGNIAAIFDLEALLTGGFCVDNEGALYGITSGIVDDEEVYWILKYQLP